MGSFDLSEPLIYLLIGGCLMSIVLGLATKTGFEVVPEGWKRKVALIGLCLALLGLGYQARKTHMAALFGRHDTSQLLDQYQKCLDRNPGVVCRPVYVPDSIR